MSELFTISVDKTKRLVQLCLVGSWVEKDTRDLLRALEDAVQRLGVGAPWYLLVDARRWSVQSPEVQAGIARCMQHNISKGLARTARLGGAPIATMQLGRLARENRVVHRVFAVEFDAFQWLFSGDDPKDSP